MSAVVEQIELLEDEWRGCYKQSWSGLIAPEAFAHPAKYSRALIRQIYDHVIEHGWVERGSHVIDPFGGVALGGLDAMLNGLNWTGCELEAKFHGLGNQNIALWNERYSRMPQWGSARLLNGDSRKLVEVLSAADCCVSSPPYAGNVKGDYLMSEDGKTHRRDVDRGFKQGHGCFRGSESYGQSDGQLGSMRDADFDVAITSPPYNPPMSQDHNGTRGGQRGTTPSEKGAFVKYGNAEGQLEGMSMDGHAIVVSSPPFPQPYTGGGGINVKGYGDGSDKVGERTYQGKGGERSEGNLETLDAQGFQAAVSSPPYEGLRMDGGKIAKEQAAGMRPYSDDPVDAWFTTRDQANIANNHPETFWSASRTILEQLYQVITPGGHAVFVVKAFVRNKQIVDFPAQWAQLCEAVGFKLIHRHKALLTEDYGTQGTFDGEGKTLTIARKSFFRRLAESKGSPRIDWESVLCFEK